MNTEDEVVKVVREAIREAAIAVKYHERKITQAKRTLAGWQVALSNWNLGISFDEILKEAADRYKDVDDDV